MIRSIGGVQVMIDRDLAALYGVSVKRLNEQVKRNQKRFPSDFMFQRIETVEKRQLMTDVKVDAILARLDVSETPAQGVFYDGQLWAFGRAFQSA